MARQYVFWGGYGGNNIGDEAILWAMSRLIRKFDPGARQHVLLTDPLRATARAQYAEWDIQVIEGPLLRSLIRLRRARLIVGGGQMIDDTTYGWPVGWSSLFLLVNRISGYRPLVLCVGAERLTKTLQRFLVRRMYGLASVITCRDEESSEVVRAAGVPREKVWTTRDVVFSLDRGKVPQWSAKEGRRRTIAVVVAYDPNRVTEDISRYESLVSGLRQGGFRVELVAHDLRPEYDVQAVLAVKARFAADEEVQIAAATSVEDAFRIYARVEAVVSARMHPLIMAMLAGTLPVAYGGKAKVKSLLAVSGMPSIAGDDPAALAVQLETLIQLRPALLAELAGTSTAFRQKVEETTTRALALGEQEGARAQGTPASGVR